eukprot:GHRQ01022085.1.p1 GENE.GHRQ01022085.1~~GHRQ01022085.1.p1  ORF type:complete len:218 (-),score=38.95 GHRQ01022085.1:865-1518(-)
MLTADASRLLSRLGLSQAWAESAQRTKNCSENEACFTYPACLHWPTVHQQPPRFHRALLLCLTEKSGLCCITPLRADGLPLVVSEPAGAVASAFMELGAIVVREVAKLSVASKHGMTWDEQQWLMRVVLPGTSTGSAASAPFYLQPAVVRRHDTSARSINEWTGEALGAGDVSDDIKPISVSPLGNYAVQIQWEDGFNQVGCSDAMPVRQLPHQEQM